jgi:NAD(P)-dependent dehydrogenase (short-subunit alcohol dehydrogenase family)
MTALHFCLDCMRWGTTVPDCHGRTHKLASHVPFPQMTVYHRFTREAIAAKGTECATSMEGKTCVITGATSGIGRAAAEALAAMGGRIVMVARNKQRGEAMLAKLRDRFPLAGHRIYYADLLRLAEVKRVAAEIAAAEPRVDVLLNNAGAMFAWRKITPDGFERTFALNHVAPFVLTHGLRERLFAAAPARVVNTTGALHISPTCIWRT